MKKKKVLVIGKIWNEVRYKTRRSGKFPVADKQYPAGNGYITARRIAEQGRSVSLVSCIGDDETAYEILWELEKAGVDTKYLKRERNRNTPQRALLYDGAGRCIERTLIGERITSVPEGPELMRIRLEEYGVVILEDLETWPQAGRPELEVFLKRAFEKNCITLAALGEGFGDEEALELSGSLGPYCDVFLCHAGGSQSALLAPVRRIRQDETIRSRTHERKERLEEAFREAAERLLEGGAGAVVLDTGEEGRFGFFCRSRDGRLEQFLEEQHRLKTVDYCTQGTFTAYFAAAYSYLRYLKGAARRAAKAARLAADSGKIYLPVEGLKSLEEEMTVLYEPVKRTRDERKLLEEDVMRMSYPVNLIRAIGVMEEVPDLFRAEAMTKDQQEGLLACLGELEPETSLYLDYRYRLHWSREECSLFLGLCGREQDERMAQGMEYLRREECLRRILYGRSGNRLRLLREREGKAAGESAPENSREADGLTLKDLKFSDGILFRLKAEGVDSPKQLAGILVREPQEVLKIPRIGKKKIALMLQRLLEYGVMTEEDTIRSLDLLLSRENRNGIEDDSEETPPDLCTDKKTLQEY